MKLWFENVGPIEWLCMLLGILLGIVITWRRK